MNKTLFAAALAALTAGSAFAQSSVTLYGRLNVTAERQARNGTHFYQEVNNASRFGLKGVEDLGGGLKAGFALESGFNVDTGVANGTGGNTAFWARQSEVNLGSAQFGTVRLGNFISEAYFATADYVSLHNHDTGTSADAFYAYLGRNTNKVAYRLPEFVKGLSVEGAVSAGEGAAGATRTYDGAINYNVGPAQLGFGMQRANQAEQYAGRVLFTFGPVLLGGYYQRDKNGIAGSGFVNNGVVANQGKRNTYRLSGAYLLGPWEFHLNGGYADDYSRVANSSAKQYTAAVNYNLSKRTKVYAFATKIDDSAARLYGGDFSSVAVGVRHNF